MYSRRLATAIREGGAAESVEDLLKLTQAKVSIQRTPRPQIANVQSTLGAYHLYLGDAA